ncbi:hypothetical protein BGW36DRAFT_428407 [Talaromyces proteolyticus]|uniref:Uncharacterized protein n=1 Tax=Talaromyces proteolyticus TaxID=1131652 RepID=A0AAD4KPY1_9EURO|nr:uncharacterized protein BGW36DRAFT_428407 [Talaromyces proteolyticus]KAH8696393.1 hypothetical protein BGW36DRAFT_428407 [Talaromyces proteolyticus]
MTRHALRKPQAKHTISLPPNGIITLKPGSPSLVRSRPLGTSDVVLTFTIPPPSSHTTYIMHISELQNLDSCFVHFTLLTQQQLHYNTTARDECHVTVFTAHRQDVIRERVAAQIRKRMNTRSHSQIHIVWREFDAGNKTTTREDGSDSDVEGLVQGRVEVQYCGYDYSPKTNVDARVVYDTCY